MNVTLFARWLGAWLKRAEEDKTGRLPYDLSDESVYYEFNVTIAASRGVSVGPGQADEASDEEIPASECGFV